MTYQAGITSKDIKYFVNVHQKAYGLDRSLIEDFVMDAIVKFYETRPEENNLRAWFHKTINNLIIDHFRREKRELYVKDFEKESIDYTELHFEIEKLKPFPKKVIKMFYYDNLRSLEIAEILNVKDTVVRQTLRNTRILLKSKLNGFYS